MILSSETLNVESAAPIPQENVLQQQPGITIESEISEKFGDTFEVIEKNHANSDEISKSDSAEQEIIIDAILSRTETQLPQPDVLEKQQNTVIPEAQSSAEPSLDGNV